MRAPKALSIFIALISVFAGGGAALAQDAIPETPPELRDFRLDPEKAAPKPKAEPTQPVVVTPPPVVATLPDRVYVRQRAQPKPQVAEPRARASQAQTLAAEPQPKVADPVVAANPPKAVEPEPASVVETQANPVAYWQIAAGLAFAAMLVLVLGGWWFRGRRIAPKLESQSHPDAAVAPVIAHDAIPTLIVSKVPAPVIKKPDIALEFIPEKATISFATLTVKGQLLLTNTGDAPAKDVKLRAGLISAGEQQSNAIRAFHAASSDIKPEDLAEAKPGETIAMSMELTVPLTEMRSFAMGEQRLIVPIVVANLTYHGIEEKSDMTRIACMIGREATPPVPKMGAFRLDLGPRSFAPLGRRLLDA